MAHEHTALWVIGVVAIAALIVGAIALAYNGNDSKHHSSKDKSLIPFCGGILTDGQTVVSVGTGDRAIAIANGSFSAASSLDINDQVRAFSFVASYSGYLEDLYLNVSAAVEDGAATQDLLAAIYVTPHGGSSCDAVVACGANLVPTKLTVVAPGFTATRSELCVKSCSKVKVHKGDRVALVLSAGTTEDDLLALYTVSAGVTFKSC